MYLLVWLDDLLFASKSNMINAMKKKLDLKKKNQMKVLRQVSYFLGMQFETTLDNITIFQSKYIQTMLKMFGK